MSTVAKNVLCRYHYDPLDRLVGMTPASDDGLLRFYCKSRLATEIQGAVQHSIFQQGEQLLAQQHKLEHLVETSMLATDEMRSVLQVFGANLPYPTPYSPYGHDPMRGSALRFNGEWKDSITGHYLLGNGYRAFNPVLMRFNSPDNMSPFGKGGVNPYGYCFGDPINYSDSSGHFGLWRLKAFLSRNNRMPSLAPPVRAASNKYKLYDLVLDANVPKKEIIRSYKKLIYSSRSKHRTPIPVRKIDSIDQLGVIQTWPPNKIPFDFYETWKRNTVSFIYTQRKELIVGNVGHLALSALAKSDRVISAGTMIRLDGRNFIITNSSGHFKPDFASLDPVRKRLGKLGATSVDLVPHRWE